MNNSSNNILDNESQRTTGINALVSNIEAARALSDIVKTTLGPMGMDKMLIDSIGDTTITNDGAKILNEMEIEHPGAKILVDVAKTQESEVGDGTTSAVILCGELLNRAQDLIKQNIHPTLITRVYKNCSNKALDILDKNAIKINPKNKKLIKDITESAMTGKTSEHSKDFLSEMIYEGIIKVAEEKAVPLSKIKIQKAIGSDVTKSKLIEGVVLDKKLANVNMPRKILNSKVLLIDFPLEVRELDSDAKVNINSLEEYESFLDSEENYLLQIVSQIENSGANVVICQKGIDDKIAYYLSKKNIMAVRRTRKSDLEKLSYALNIPILSNISDLEESSLGKCKLTKVEEINGEDYVFISGCPNPKAISFFLRGSTNHILDEVERAIEDALGDINSVFKSEKIVAGGGAIEVELFKELEEYSKNFNGREQLIAKEYANAFLIIPKILCENCGHDEIDTITNLISKHDKGESKAGINGHIGLTDDTIKIKIIEPINVKEQIIKTSIESTSILLRIDDVIAAKKLKGEDVTLN